MSNCRRANVAPLGATVTRAYMSYHCRVIRQELICAVLHRILWALRHKIFHPKKNFDKQLVCYFFCSFIVVKFIQKLCQFSELPEIDINFLPEAEDYNWVTKHIQSILL